MYYQSPKGLDFKAQVHPDKRFKLKNLGPSHTHWAHQIILINPQL